MVTESEIIKYIVIAFGRLHPSMRMDATWRMSESVCRTVAREIGFPIPDGAPIPKSLRMFDIPVEIVESDEVLIVFKVM